MPAQQRRWLDQERAPPLPRQQLAERRQQDTIGRPQPRPPDLAAQHLQLMPQHQDLKLVRPLRTTKRISSSKQTANDPVSEGQTPKEQTSSTHLPTLPARTTPSYSSLSVHARPRRSGARVSGTHTLDRVRGGWLRLSPVGCQNSGPSRANMPICRRNRILAPHRGARPLVTRRRCREQRGHPRQAPRRHDALRWRLVRRADRRLSTLGRGGNARLISAP